jgi:hypothetical protein
MTRHALTPKAEFLADAKRAGAHQDMVLSPEFKKALEIALLQYAMNLGGDTADQQRLITVGLRLEGAKGFIEELLNLGNRTKPIYQKDPAELEPV